MENIMKINFTLDMDPKEIIEIVKAIKKSATETADFDREYLRISADIERIGQEVRSNKKAMKERENVEEWAMKAHTEFSDRFEKRCIETVSRMDEQLRQSFKSFNTLLENVKRATTAADK